MQILQSRFCHHTHASFQVYVFETRKQKGMSVDSCIKECTLPSTPKAFYMYISSGMHNHICRQYIAGVTTLEKIGCSGGSLRTL